MARRWEPLLEQVARERYPRLVARAMLLVPSRSDAEDLVQEALVATFSARARFESAAQAEQYVRRAIVSRFVDRARRSGRERSAAERAVARPQPSTADLAEQGLSTNLEVALLALSPRVRACVVLRHLEDLSVRETAALLGLSEGAVKRYVSDGVAALNAALGTTSPDDRDPVVLVQTEEVRRGA
ncbi:sigma-70 family RNA polymerase sigma factor [Cellulomonas humilata]|uniref:Sigma-70 family RNA polymerase sigma factor n=1 Tax=Cellulomonas humilata TaxID=144055 RepID=A0A7Y6DZ33_9CELL|nr:sigma-70 family RNA polymerase sigma factor [Cellulomonas humilata]NUU19030.1 sigma-70 family RNA polymerase sigma factor [Cellulomonas humilata]